MKPSTTDTPIDELGSTPHEKHQINVIIDTPKGSRNKYKYDEELGLFRLSSVLPIGASFPFDFGFIPQTSAPDGDPLDVLVLMDTPAFVGCLVVARPIGFLKANQTEKKGETVRNDRIVAVADVARTYGDIKSYRDLNPILVEEIEHFFVAYNEARDVKFTPLGWRGESEIWKIVEKAQAQWAMAGKKAA